MDLVEHLKQFATFCDKLTSRTRMQLYRKQKHEINYVYCKYWCLDCHIHKELV